jgi:hypothetical protein
VSLAEPEWPGALDEGLLPLGTALHFELPRTAFARMFYRRHSFNGQPLRAPVGIPVSLDPVFERDELHEVEKLSVEIQPVKAALRYYSTGW